MFATWFIIMILFAAILFLYPVYTYAISVSPEFGVISETIGPCIVSDGDCSKPGTRTVIYECNPNTNTGYGCLIDGKQFNNTIIQTYSCNDAKCVSSEWYLRSGVNNSCQILHKTNGHSDTGTLVPFQIIPSSAGTLGCLNTPTQPGSFNSVVLNKYVNPDSTIKTYSNADMQADVGFKNTVYDCVVKDKNGQNMCSAQSLSALIGISPTGSNFPTTGVYQLGAQVCIQTSCTDYNVVQTGDWMIQANNVTSYLATTTPATTSINSTRSNCDCDETNNCPSTDVACQTALANCIKFKQENLKYVLNEQCNIIDDTVYQGGRPTNVLYKGYNVSSLGCVYPDTSMTHSPGVTSTDITNLYSRPVTVNAQGFKSFTPTMSLDATFDLCKSIPDDIAATGTYYPYLCSRTTYVTPPFRGSSQTFQPKNCGNLDSQTGGSGFINLGYQSNKTNKVVQLLNKNPSCVKLCRLFPYPSSNSNTGLSWNGYQFMYGNKALILVQDSGGVERCLTAAIINSTIQPNIIDLSNLIGFPLKTLTGYIMITSSNLNMYNLTPIEREKAQNMINAGALNVYSNLTKVSLSIIGVNSYIDSSAPGINATINCNVNAKYISGFDVTTDPNSFWLQYYNNLNVNNGQLNFTNVDTNYGDTFEEDNALIPYFTNSFVLNSVTSTTVDNLFPGSIYNLSLNMSGTSPLTVSINGDATNRTVVSNIRMIMYPHNF